jgi:hypothetical protein
MEIGQEFRIKSESDWRFTPDFRRRVLHSLARISDAWWSGTALMSLANAGARYRIVQVHDVPVTRWVLAAALANKRVKRRRCGAAQKPPTTSQSAVLRNGKMNVFRASVWVCSAPRLIYPVSWPTPFKGQTRTASVCPGRVDCAESSLSQSWRDVVYEEKNKLKYLLLHHSSEI